MSAPLGPGPRSRVRRMPENALYDEATVFSVIDAAPFCHVAAILDGRATSMPMMHVREGRTLYLHGSRSNATLRAILAARAACVSFALYDGVRLARSGFETSLAYRSVVVFGAASDVGSADLARVANLFVDRLTPGRSLEVRPAQSRELDLTLLVALQITEASAKVSSGPTEESSEDAALGIWSGVVPVHSVAGDPLPALSGAMATNDIAEPASLAAMAKRPPRAVVDELRAHINAIEPVNLREARSLRALGDRLSWPGDLFDPTGDPRHLTASAFVVSSRGVVLHRHKVLGRWLQPGGHVDAGESVLDAARREVREETGLDTTALYGARIFHVDVHQGPRGHTHYDLRYVLESDGRDPAPEEGESREVYWFSFDEARDRAEEELREPLNKLEAYLASTRRETLET